MSKTPGQVTAAELFRDLRANVREVRATVRHIGYLGELMADRNADFQSKLDNMQTTVDRVQARVADHETAAAANAEALKTEIQGLKDQLAQGISPDQTDAAFSRIDAIQADLESTGQGTPTTGGEPVDTTGDVGGSTGGTGGEAVIPTEPGAPGTASGPASSPTGTNPPPSDLVR
jgi:ABC-type transporter Mla subunit MlaD